MKLSQKVSVLVLLFWINSSFTFGLTGQETSQEKPATPTLTEQLLKEDASKLAEQARQYGNIVRGAILFHQGNINCAKCHRPESEKLKLGPNLSKLDPTLKDDYIVESILLPSKVIKKGFESVSILTIDGDTLNGMLVREDQQAIVIRTQQNIDQLLTVSRSDIDEVAPSPISNMPAKLADELKDRQQFLDLLRYVIDLRERGPADDSSVVQSEQRRTLSPELEGLVAIRKFNCVACHEAQQDFVQSRAKQPPRLGWSTKHLSPTYIEKFITAPHQVKPGTTMPELLGSVEGEQKQQAARAIANYLFSESVNEFRPEPIEQVAVNRGYGLFHSVGCVACHSPRNAAGQENRDASQFSDSIPLGELAPKYSLGSLVEFLKDPLAIRVSGHMPDMQLSHREAIDIASYLLQGEMDQSNYRFDESLISRGRQLFRENNCANCHADFLAGKGNSAVATATPFKDLKSGQGCLSMAEGAWPRFSMTEAERSGINAFLENPPAALSSQQNVSVSMRQLNCIACHRRGDLGGVTTERNPHFKTTNLNLGDQGRIPPSLTNVGAKLKPKWMRDVMVNARTIRPYMETRMPQYGEPNISHLIELTQEMDRLEETEFATFKDQKEMRKKGLELVGNKGLNCVACHTYKFKLSDTMPAVDLTEMGERLEKDWFYQYMLAPQKFSPNTVMPSFWPGGKAIRPDIEGTPSDQIEAVWQYLLDGRQAGTPRGVVRKPLEIVVTDEAKMLRRSYPGIGKRGIGVGYPGGINLAYDAEQMRLASLWRGKFVDPVGVWTGQGHGNVRPMERTVGFPKGPDLDDQNEPWEVDDGRPPQHRFKGYVLDGKQRPKFQYEFEGLSVTDFFEEMNRAGQVVLKRTITINAPEGRKGIRLRIAGGTEVARREDGGVQVGERLLVRMISQHHFEIRKAGDQKILSAEFNVVAGEPQTLSVEYQLK